MTLVDAQGGAFTIGRKPGNSLQVTDASVSGRHAELRNRRATTVSDSRSREHQRHRGQWRSPCAPRRSVGHGGRDSPWARWQFTLIDPAARQCLDPRGERPPYRRSSRCGRQRSGSGLGRHAHSAAGTRRSRSPLRTWSARRERSKLAPLATRRRPRSWPVAVPTGGGDRQARATSDPRGRAGGRRAAAKVEPVAGNSAISRLLLRGHVGGLAARRGPKEMPESV